MRFRKDPYQVARSEAFFGRNVIVTDNHDWTTQEIVERCLDCAALFAASAASLC